MPNEIFYEVVAEEARIRRHGDVAWLSCRIVMKGMLTNDCGAIPRAARSTFVFETQGDQLQMARKHSERVKSLG